MAVKIRLASEFDPRGFDAAEQRLLKLKDKTMANSKSIEGSWMRAGAGVIGFGDKMSSIGTSMASTGDSLTRNVTLPLAAMGGLAVREAVRFESAFAGVRKTVDASESQFAALETGIRDMSKELPSSREEIAGVAEAAGQLGIKTEDILGFTRVMIDLGESTNLSSEQAATALARFANITQMSADDYSRLGSTIVDLGNNMATTEAEIVNFGLRISGAGKQVGMTESDIMAVGAALSSVGIEAEAGGSAISKTMIGIEAAVQKGGNELKLWAQTAGMSAQEFTNAWQSDPAQALNSVVVGLADMESQGGSTLGMLEQLGITEIRQRDALLRAAGAGDLLSEALKISGNAWTENSALATEAAQRYATTESQWEMVKNKIGDSALTLGNSLVPALMDAVGAAQPMIEGLGNLATKFSELDSEQQTNILKWAGIAMAAGPVLSIGGRLINVVGGITQGLGHTITNTGRFIGGLKGADGAASTTAGKLGGLASNIATGTANLAKSAAAWVVDTAKKVVNTGATWASIAAQKAAALGAKLWAGAQWLLNAAMSANPIGLVVVAIGALVAAFVIAWKKSETFRNFVIGAWDAIKTAATNIFGAVKDWIVNTWDNIKTKTADIWNGITSFFKSWGPYMLAALTGPIGLLIVAVVKNWDKIKSLTSNAFNAAKDFAVNAFGRLKDGISEKIAGVVGFVKDLPGKLKSALGNLGSLLWNAGSSIIQGLWNGLKAKWESVKSWVGGLGKWIADHKGPIEYDRKLLVPAGSAIIGGLYQSMKDEFPSVTSLMGDMTRELGAFDVSLGPGAGRQGSTTTGQAVTNNYNTYYQIDGITIPADDKAAQEAIKTLIDSVRRARRMQPMEAM